MIRTRQSWCGFAIGLFLSAGAALAGGTSTDSFIDTIKPADANPPQVLLRTQGEPDWKPAQAGLELLPGDSVQTKDHGTCTIQVGGMAVIDLEPNSILTIPGNGSQAAVTRVKVEQGAAWSTVRHLEPQETFSVETQHSVGGVKGTQFQTNVSGGGEAEWNLVDGSLQMKTAAGGTPFALQSGQTTTFGRNGAVRIRPRKIANLTALRARFQNRFGLPLRTKAAVNSALRHPAQFRRRPRFAPRKLGQPGARPGQQPGWKQRLRNWKRRKPQRY